MDTPALTALALACAPLVHPTTAMALVSTESSGNPLAIGVVGGQLRRQARTQAEAISTARHLQGMQWNFSVGLAQINVHNLPRLGLSLEQAFDPCTSLQAMQVLIVECFERASARRDAPDQDIQATARRALSCYYSGDFATGYRHGYVARVVRASLRAGIARQQAP